MSITELKQRIISRITSIENELILEEIFKLVEKESEIDSLYRLTDTERKAIEIGLADLKDGRVYSTEVAENMIQTWLKK
jgi:hypothetical protein